jgi:hypothetical protein
MNRVVKAALWAIPPVLILVVIPFVIISIVPPTSISQAEALLGISIPTFVTDLAIFGIVLAALSFLKTWAYKWSALRPVASSLYVIASYALLLFLLGFGNPLTFGTANIGVSPAALSGGQGTVIGTINISLVSTFLALLGGIAVAIKIAHGGMKFREDRRFHELDLGGEAAQVELRSMQAKND